MYAQYTNVFIVCLQHIIDHRYMVLCNIRTIQTRNDEIKETRRIFIYLTIFFGHVMLRKLLNGNLNLDWILKMCDGIYTHPHSASAFYRALQMALFFTKAKSITILNSSLICRSALLLFLVRFFLHLFCFFFLCSQRVKKKYFSVFIRNFFSSVYFSFNLPTLL